MSLDEVSAARHSLMEAIATVLVAGAPRQEDGYLQLFAKNSLAMWVYDVDTQQILDANDAAQERYGYSHSEFTCLSLSDMRPAEDVPKFRALTRDLPHFDRTGPWRHRTRDGTVLQVLITSHAMRFGPFNARLVIVEDPDDAPI
jgi:PAS domain S-box-containing protein